jgi:hypothetical protein
MRREDGRTVFARRCSLGQSEEADVRTTLRAVSKTGTALYR